MIQILRLRSYFFQSVKNKSTNIKIYLWLNPCLRKLHHPNHVYSLDLIKKYSTDGSFNISLDSPEIQKYLENLRQEYEVLVSQTQTDKNINKRILYLKPIMDLFQERINLYGNLTILDELTPANSKDDELLSLAKEEKNMYNEKIKALNSELLDVLVPVEPLDGCTEIILEISAGVGGQEAMLFARELFDMYCAYIVNKAWVMQIAEQVLSDLGGLRHASLFVSGSQVYQHLKHEAGVHRVQRIPSTEKSGRVHTSTVTVATLPQPTMLSLIFEVILKDKDLRIETKRSSGAGGQHVNTTDSAVRIVHLPTGIVVESQVDRSQIKNREFALQRLKTKIYQNQLDKQMAETQAKRKMQVGSSLRSEKIRTYNYNQDRITDHRIGNTVHNLKSFLLGEEGLDTLIRQLLIVERRDRLLQAITCIDTVKGT
uniref:Prokaryotic-type class I peptide chain release factors domain-containing protein n=1 Tax=Timema genevievae TaxID=629358 RepID=A0A7R9K299_TIMGE|nr:unnamed protein product [Timema genevievae]